MLSKFKGKHIIEFEKRFMDIYVPQRMIDRWEVFYEQELDNKFSVGEYVNIKGDEVEIERVVHNLDGSIEYKTSKELSFRKMY